MKKLAISLVVFSARLLAFQASGPPPTPTPTPPPTSTPQVNDPRLMDIKDYVRQVFIRRIPYEEASKFDSRFYLHY